MKIAVTGATGQLGASLVKELLRKGHQLRLLIHTDKTGVSGLPVEFKQGNILNLQDCMDLCEGMDAVFHLAAFISISGDRGGMVWDINVNGTENILKACVENKIKKLLHFSSIHAYNPYPHEGQLDESRELSLERGFAYERSKAQGHWLVLQYVKDFGLDASIVCPTGVLGPEDHLPSVKGEMLIDFYRGRIPMLLKGGFDWVDTRDVVNGAIAAFEKGRKGESYLLSGHYHTLVELSQIIGRVTGKRMPKMIAPNWLLRLFIPFALLWARIMNKEPMYSNESLKSLEEGHPNISHKKASEELGYQARSTEDTIKDTIDWFKSQGYIS